MKKETNKPMVVESDPTANSVDQRKEYSKPKLTKYGDISELVLMMGGAGADGGPPFASLT